MEYLYYVDRITHQILFKPLMIAAGMTHIESHISPVIDLPEDIELTTHKPEFDNLYEVHDNKIVYKCTFIERDAVEIEKINNELVNAHLITFHDTILAHPYYYFHFKIEGHDEQFWFTYDPLAWWKTVRSTYSKDSHIPLLVAVADNSERLYTTMTVTYKNMLILMDSYRSSLRALSEGIVLYTTIMKEEGYCKCIDRNCQLRKEILDRAQALGYPTSFK